MVMPRGRRARDVHIIAERHKEMPTNAVFYVYGSVERMVHRRLKPSLVGNHASRSTLFLAPAVRRDTRVVSFYTPVPSVSDTWTPVMPVKGSPNVDPHLKKALVVFLNSVFGIYTVIRDNTVPDFTRLGCRSIEKAVGTVDFESPPAEIGRHLAWALHALRSTSLRDPDKIQQLLRNGPRGPIDAAALELVEELCGGHTLVDLSIYRAVNALL